MRKMWKNVCLMVAMLFIFAVPVSASATTQVISPEFPEDDYMNKDDEDKTPEDDYMKSDESRSPKTGDESLMIYGMALAAIAVAGSIVIARKEMQ